MKLRSWLSLCAALAIGSASSAGLARADDDEDEPAIPADTTIDEDGDGEDEDDVASYGSAGLWEIGGTVGGFWTPDQFTLNFGPSVGYFVIDYLELTLTVRFLYENVRDDDGQRTDGWTGEAVFEPSYHLPVYEDRVFLLGGLGVGAAYDGDTAGFELVPRVGVNLTTGLGGIVTPSVRVPIIMGVEHDDNGDGHFNVSPNVGFEIGYSNQF